MKNKNEIKLMKNLDNIIKKYIKIDDQLLETIANKDFDGFKEQVVEKSSDHFLSGIIDNYETFTQALFDEIESQNSSQLDNILGIETEKEEYKNEVSKGRTKNKPQYSLSKPGKYKAKPHKHNKWSETENSRIKILIRSGKKPKEIRQEINQERLNNKQTLRTNSSINSKIYTIKKQETK